MHFTSSCIILIKEERSNSTRQSLVQHAQNNNRTGIHFLSFNAASAACRASSLLLMAASRAWCTSTTNGKHSNTEMLAQHQKSIVTRQFTLQASSRDCTAASRALRASAERSWESPGTTLPTAPPTAPKPDPTAPTPD
jgi:hypothetical protein